jgi:glycosyltransferase involved in cell wall biosynthesis
MRIAMIGPFGLRPKGTMAARALPLAHALAARGHAVTLVLPPWSWPEDAGQTWEDGGVTVQNVPLPPGLPVAGHGILATRLVRRTLAWRPDIVHCFKPKAYAGLAAWAMYWLQRSGRMRARLVVDTDDWEGAGGWNEVEDYSWAQRRFFAWQEPWGLTHSDAVTVASRALETLVWGLGVPPEKLFYVPNGYPTGGWWSGGGGQGSGQAVRRRFGLGDGPVLLLYTRFIEFKPERAIEVLKRVVAALPGARLLVVGKGLRGEEADLLQLAQTAGLQDCVMYAGWAPIEEVPEVFTASDVALYLYDDTLVNRTKCSARLIDLMAAGVPVIADAVGQNLEYIHSGQSGILVTPGDVDAMAAWAVALLRDPPQAQALGRAGAERVRDAFAWEGLALEVERAYREAAPKKNGHVRGKHRLKRRKRK